MSATVNPDKHPLQKPGQILLEIYNLMFVICFDIFLTVICYQDTAAHKCGDPGIYDSMK